MGSGGGGSNTQQQVTRERYPAYVTPFAKAYLSSLASLIFPGMTVPSTYFPKGYNFGQSGGTGGGGQGDGSGNTSAEPQPQVDPSLMMAYGNPMIGGSPYLQNMLQKNPGAVNAGLSPQAMSQVAQIMGIG